MNKEIYFAGGCFWGVQHFFDHIKGVLKTETGYANGTTKNPTYHTVCLGGTGHVETVRVLYDSNIVGLSFLIQMFFEIIDPTILNKQGNDVGTQYRTGIYYTDQKDCVIIERLIESKQKEYENKIVVEVMALSCFFSAEEFHQNYLRDNPMGYCHINQDAFRKAWGVMPLTEVQYQVAYYQATEPPFKNAFYKEDRKGIYVDIVTGAPLFLSIDKYEAGCGWPSFTKPAVDRVIEEYPDDSHGMNRTEVKGAQSKIHLGHVFTDGPIASGGLRYCINSAALRFIPYDEMDGRYQKYKKYL